jgi:hypothetical protein
MFCSRDVKEGMVEQKKQAEVSSEANLKWLSALGGPRAAPRQALRVSLNTSGLINPKRAESKWQHMCRVAILSSLNDSVMEMDEGETRLVQKRKQLGQRAMQKAPKTSDERERDSAGTLIPKCG